MSIVWKNTADDRWHCVVTNGEDAYRGVLTVTDTEGDRSVILDKEVGIMYGAPFGPDAADVAEWEELCLTAIDLYYEENPE